MKELIYTAVDSGKANTKYGWFCINEPKKINIRTDIFKSTLSEVNPTTLLNTDNLIEHDGKHYIYGLDNSQLEASNSKLSSLHKVCVFIAIAKTIINLKFDLNKHYNVDLSINVPLSDFKIKREDYEKSYLGITTTLKIHGQAISFTIKNVRLNAEGVGAIITNTNGDTTGEYHVVDIGGKNDTHITFTGYKPIKGQNGMFNNGVLVLLQQIASELSDVYDFTIEDVEKIIVKNQKKPEGFNEILNQYATQHVAKIKNQVQKYNLNPHFTTLVFTGGGSKLLKKQLDIAFSDFTKVFPDDAQFDNVTGALERIVR